jgi:hypothetical protein
MVGPFSQLESMKLRLKSGTHASPLVVVTMSPMMAGGMSERFDR